MTVTERVLEKTEFAKSNFFNIFYLVYFNSFFHFILPFLVICTLNAMIVLRLIQRRRNLPRNQRSSVQVESETKLTLMILSLTAIFCVCHVFAAIELIIVQLEKNDYTRPDHCSAECEGFSAFAETMTLVNSATNFLLYSIFGEKFRRACLRYLCPFVKTQQTAVQSQRTSQTLTSSYRGETFQLRQSDSLKS